MHPSNCSKPATQNFCFKKRQLLLENSQEILLAFKALVSRDLKNQFFPRLRPPSLLINSQHSCATKMWEDYALYDFLRSQILIRILMNA